MSEDDARPGTGDWPWSVLERQAATAYRGEAPPETSMETLNWNAGDQVILLAVTTAGVRVHLEGPVENVTTHFDRRMRPSARVQYTFEFRDGLKVLVSSWMARNRTKDPARE